VEDSCRHACDGAHAPPDLRREHYAFTGAQPERARPG
jgi:hypothetical protein